MPRFINLAQHTDLCFGVKHFFPRSVLPFLAEHERPVPTPSSIIVGLFQEVKALRHKNLCEYVELVKGKHDRIYVVTEHYENNLRKQMGKMTTVYGYMGMGEDTLRKYAYVILNAIVFLHQHGIHHANLTPDNILLDKEGNIKLSDYGLQHMTSDGFNISFSFGDPKYMSPEMIGSKLRGISENGITNPKAVSWALGMTLFELVTGKHPLEDPKEPNSTPEQIFTHLFRLWNDTPGDDVNSFQHVITSILDDENLYDLLVEKGGKVETDTEGHEEIKATNGADHVTNNGETTTTEISKLSPLLQDLIKRCLVWNPKFRPTAEELLNHPYFYGFSLGGVDTREWATKPFLRSSQLPDMEVLRDPDFLRKRKEAAEKQSNEEYTLGEIFHFWTLLGGNLEAEVAKLYKPTPSILKLPLLVPLNKFSEFYVSNNYKVRASLEPTNGKGEDENVADPSTLYDDIIHVISLDPLRKRLAQPVTSNHFQLLTTTKAKEQNFEYQRHRVQLFHDILRRFHANVPQAPHDLSDQAKIDVPPIVRGEIWAALLGIRGTDYIAEYAAIDVIKPGPSDKQISLDIPRCHQYHPLLASTVGHKKFKRVLKAWVAANNNVLVYWQGLDSTLAPFLALHFTDEAKAFACLQKFMLKYLQNFYTKDNTQALQEYLSSFRQLVAYHDPQLATHLNDIDFQPDLYAIPWFLTSFTHIFPLDRVYPLWDVLLQGPAPLPLFMAAAIIIQLRSLLLTLDFNNAILLFSNLPSIDIAECIKEGQRMFENTPVSATFTSYAGQDGKHWWEKRIPLKMAKKELAPRIAVHDVINMSWPATLLDIRPYEEFQKVRYPNSIWTNLRDKNREIATPESLEQYRGTHIITISGKDEAAQFANQLVRFNFPHVSVLNGGMDALKAMAEPLLEYGEP